MYLFYGNIRSASFPPPPSACRAAPSGIIASVIRVADTTALKKEGSFVAGKTWLHFHASGALWGVLLWGRPDPVDAQAMIRSLQTELDVEVPPHRFYVDASRLESIDSDAFTLCSRHLQAVHEVAHRSYTSIALVVPQGVPGAAVAGIYGALRVQCPFRVFSLPREAMEWLSKPPAFDEELTAILVALQKIPPIVDALALRLRGELAEPNEAAVARLLGLSQRTLQRRLREAGTSFQKELARLRIEAAQLRLVETDTPLTVIALDLGFATPQHFSRMFHEVTGETPTDYRRHRRVE